MFYHKCQCTVQCTHSTMNTDEKISCRACASTHQGDLSFREYFIHNWLVSVHEWVGVFRYKNNWMFHECQSQVFSFSRCHKCVRFMFCWAQDSTFVVITVCDLLPLCRFTADTSDVNAFLQMSRLSETISDRISEQANIPNYQICIYISWYSSHFRGASRFGNKQGWVHIHILGSNINTLLF